jgi:hypothetical protein
MPTLTTMTTIFKNVRATAAAVVVVVAISSTARVTLSATGTVTVKAVVREVKAVRSIVNLLLQLIVFCYSVL